VSEKLLENTVKSTREDDRSSSCFQIQVVDDLYSNLQFLYLHYSNQG